MHDKHVIAILHCTRLLSITTRIKTTVSMKLLFELCEVLDYCPLQQGLRPLLRALIVFSRTVLDYCPLQQGLRHTTGVS